MEKKDPALKVLSENALEQNSFSVKGNVTFGDFVWRISDDTLHCSNRLRELLEVGDSNYLTKWANLISCVAPEDVNAVNDSVSSMMAGHNVVNVNFKVQLPSGTRSLSLHGDVSRDAQGIPTVLEGVVRIHDLGASDEQIRYLINLMSETVHSVNNKFTAILGSTAMATALIYDSPGNRVFRKYLEEIDHEVFQSAELLKNLVQTAKRI